MVLSRDLSRKGNVNDGRKEMGHGDEKKRLGGPKRGVSISRHGRIPREPKLGLSRQALAVKPFAG